MSPEDVVSEACRQSPEIYMTGYLSIISPDCLYMFSHFVPKLRLLRGGGGGVLWLCSVKSSHLGCRSAPHPSGSVDSIDYQTETRKLRVITFYYVFLGTY